MRRLAPLAVGAVFGAALSWTGMTSPNVIRQALVFDSSYLYLMFGSAVLTAFIGVRLLRRLGARSLDGGEPIGWTVAPPRKRHFAGSVLFGIGWAVSDACPGPVATQLGQGIAWGAFTFAGIVIGILLFRRAERGATAEPVAEPAPA